MKGRGVIVRRVPAGATLDLRAAVLRPGRPVGAASKPGDEHPDTWFFAALAGDGRVLSTANVRPAPPPWDAGGGGWWQLRGIATAADARGRGHARAVVEAALARVDAVGGRVWCNARTGRLGFYQRLGFAPVGDERADPLTGPHRWVVRDPDPGRS